MRMQRPNLAASAYFWRKVRSLVYSRSRREGCAYKNAVPSPPYTPTDPRNGPGRRREKETKARRDGSELAGQRTGRLEALEAQPSGGRESELGTAGDAATSHEVRHRRTR